MHSQDTRQCHVCGHAAKVDLRHVKGRPGVYRCSALLACVARQRGRDAHLDERYTLTPLGRAYLAVRGRA